MTVIMFKSESSKITPVEVLKHTEHQVFLLNGMREWRRTVMYSWHETWDDACRFLSYEASSGVERAKTALEAAEMQLVAVSELRP